MTRNCCGWSGHCSGRNGITECLDSRLMKFRFEAVAFSLRNRRRWPLAQKSLLARLCVFVDARYVCFFSSPSFFLTFSPMIHLGIELFSPMAMAMQCRIEVYPLLTCRIEVYPLLTRVEACPLSSPDIGSRCILS